MVESIFYKKKPSKLRQALIFLFFVLFIAFYMWLMDFRWTFIIPMTVFVIYRMIRDWGAKYILKDNGDLVFRPGFIRSHKKMTHVNDIDTIDYTPHPGQVSIMFHSKQGFIFASPEQPEEMIHAIKQRNPAIKVEVQN